MNNYKQTVRFTREINVSANSAEEATLKMEQLINDSEFSGDVRCEGYYFFEDEIPDEPEEEGDVEDEKFGDGDPSEYGDR